MLGATQIVIAVAGDSLFVLSARRWRAGSPSGPRGRLAQRWVLGGVFAGIAVKLALDERR